MPDNPFHTVYLVGLAVGCVIRAVYARRHPPAEVVDRRVTWFEYVLMYAAGSGLFFVPLIYVFTSWLDFADYRLPISAGCIGSGVFIVALWLLWRSHVDLGRNWSAIVEIRSEHRLITEGIYRRIRHPMYAAHWIWAVAQLLLLSNWIAGPALAVTFWPLYLVRVAREEQAVLERFGDEYRQYMARTGRLFPRLWGD